MSVSLNTPQIIKLSTPNALVKSDQVFSNSDPSVTILIPELWKTVFNLLPITTLCTLKHVCCAWNTLSKEVINKKIELTATQLSQSYPQAFFKYKQIQDKHQKPINWEVLLSKESSSEETLIKKGFCQSYSEAIRLPEKFNRTRDISNSVTINNFLILYDISNEIRLYFPSNEKSNEIPAIPHSFNPEIKINFFTKISETMFSVGGTNSEGQSIIKIYELSSKVKSPESPIPFYKNIEWPKYLSEYLFFLNENILIHGTINLTNSDPYFCLNAFSLRNSAEGGRVYKLFIPPSEKKSIKLYSHDIYEYSNGYIVIRSNAILSPTFFFVYHLETEKLIFRTSLKLLKVDYQIQKALLYNSEEKSVCVVDLKEIDKIPRPLFSLKNYYNCFITPNFYFFLGDGQLLIYDVKKLNLSTIPFEIEAIKKICSADFVKVTDRLIILNLWIQVKNEGSFHRIVVYKFNKKEVKVTLLNHQIETNLQGDFIINDSHIIVIDREDYKSCEHFLKMYSYGPFLPKNKIHTTVHINLIPSTAIKEVPEKRLQLNL